MKFDLCPGDRVLVLNELSLGYGGHFPYALVSEVARATPTRLVVSNNYYRKEDGVKIGGSGKLLDPENPRLHDEPLEVMTYDEARGLYASWRRFEDTLRSILGRNSPASGLGNMFRHKELRDAILEESRRHEHEILSLYKKHKNG